MQENKFAMKKTIKPHGIDTIFPGEIAADLNDLAYQGDKLRARLHQNGVILFRGFHVHTPEEFKQLANIFTNNLMADNGEHNPLPGAGGVYTPVAYSAKEKLLWHNENSFNQTWPLMIMFGAAIVAKKGGQTPISDSRKILTLIDKEVRDEFSRKGVMYVRTHGFGLGRSWQETHRINDKLALEKQLNKDGIYFEWRDDDKLITRQIRPAIVNHPITGDSAWFTQAQHWHPYCLSPGVRDTLLSFLSEDTLPRNCHFGDGSKISDAVMQHILDAYEQSEIAFNWEQGDVMVVDNVLFAHARNAYEGERKLFVTMGERSAFLDDVSSSSKLCSLN
jgi:alpha-ketoglutarate-dependent taurine dioxygenase